MKEHLLHLFSFNRQSNVQMVAKIREMADLESASRLLSHLVNCQYRWLARLTEPERAVQMSWWDPLYSLDELPDQFSKSTDIWIEFIDQKSDTDLGAEVTYFDASGRKCAALLQDIALQLNFHSIHHRAQIQMMLKAQGVEPDAIDYIASHHRVL
ncbi:MAG: DinB family protein [Flavobacteriales bacterium]|nr:DinB family protein [Flavobacteriales bacterium]